MILKLFLIFINLKHKKYKKMQKINFFFFIIFIYLKKYIKCIFGRGVYQYNIISAFSLPEDVNGLVSNDLTHETFSEITNNGYDSLPYESSIFFIIGKSDIISLYFASNSIKENSVNENLNDLYSISSSYLYIPKYLLYDSSIGDSYHKSVLFGFCTNSNYISSYIFEYSISGDSLTDQELINKNTISYDNLQITETNNKCSGSSFIGKNNFGNRVYISNAYSKYKSDNEIRNIYYEIKIFEYMVKTYELKYYVGRSFKVEIINLSTNQPSNFDNIILEKLDGIIFNKEGISLIKCRIINSFINENQDDYYYDKEIIILCLYYAKDLINSVDNEPKLVIKLDLFKNTIGSTQLSLISSIIIKNSIVIDKYDDEGLNYIYPSLISFKSENEIYVVLKGMKYSEIYSVGINLKTLILSNLNLLDNFGYIDYDTNTGLLLYTNNYEYISFNIREFIGSFYIVKYDSDTKIISIFIYGDKNKNEYQDTEIRISIETYLNLPTTNIKRIITSSISNVLLSILLVTDMGEYIVFIQYPMCEPLNIKVYQLFTNEIKDVLFSTLVPTSITDDQHSNVFIYSNYIIDIISRTNSVTSSKIDFNNDYLTSSEKSEYLDITYSNENKNQILLKANNHIKDLEIIYNLYYEDLALSEEYNKIYSTTCSLYIDICNDYCRNCYAFSDDNSNNRCINCLQPDFYPLIDDTSNCRNKSEIPIEGYYFDEDNNIFIQCDTSCKYCIGPSQEECLKCNIPNYFLLESNLQTIEINSKIYEYSKCVSCSIYIFKYYTNSNFDDGSVNVCLDESLISCPENYPYELNDVCYQNCKNSETEYIYGNPRSQRCEDECDNYIYYYENNTCVDSCPENYYYFQLRYYCIKQCINSLYNLKEEKVNENNENYFELSCQAVCPILTTPYYFEDENNNKYCIPNCSKFSYYFNEIETFYNIYYKNTLICRSKSQCNEFSDEYSTKKYVASVKDLLSSGEISSKRVCLAECKEVNQYLLPQSYIDIENTKEEGVDCTEECPEGYGNYSWTCIDCSSIYYYEYEKNCIEECPSNSFQLTAYPYKCFSSCPDDYPYQDNFDYRCYKTLEEVPIHIEEFGGYCDKTKHLWYTVYNVNNVPIVKCLNDTDVYLSCAAVIPEYPYTNKANHECVKSCPISYTNQNEHTKFCDLDTNKQVDFNEIRKTLLTHELIDNITKNESNLIIYEKDFNSEYTITFYLFNYSNVLEKIRNGIEPEVSVDETNGDIREDPLSPFYYQNGTELIISDQCEDLLRQSYYIPYYNSFDYTYDNITYIDGIKYSFIETSQYYVPQYLLGIIMNIKRDNTSQVEYKLYNPKNPSIELDLSLCYAVEDSKTNMVTINIERDLNTNIYNIFDEIYSYYINNMNNPFEGLNSGKFVYDIFNKNSDFFMSPCTPFTNKYGTDVLSVDRYKDFYIRIDFCENNCTYLGTRKSYKNLNKTYIQITCQCPIKVKYNKQNDISFAPVVEGDDKIDESGLSNKEKEDLYEERVSEYDIYLQFIKTQTFMCYDKILSIKSIFTKENILGLFSLICFLLIIILYITQCIIGLSHIQETLKFIRIGKFDHGLNIFFTIKDYLKEFNKREQCYRNRKNKKKVTQEKIRPTNKTLIQTKHKIKRAEDNLKRKMEGKPMIDYDKKPDELELIRERVEKLEEQLRLKYLKKGLKDKKIKIRVGKVNEEENPEEIKNLKMEIKQTKKRLKELKRQKKEIDLEKMNYHTLSSIASIPSNPPKRILSEMPMPDEISDRDEFTSKENMVTNSEEEKEKEEKKHKEKKKKKEKEKEKKKEKKSKKDKEKKDKEKKEKEKKEKKEEEKKEEEKKEEKKDDDGILNINIKQEEEKKEEEKKDNDLIVESELGSSWESYDSNDPKGLFKKLNKKEKEKKDKEDKDKKRKEEKKRHDHIQKLLIKKREKEKKRMIDLLPEQEEQRKRIEKIKRKEREEEIRRKEEELRKQKEEEEKKRKEEEEMKKQEEQKSQNDESNKDKNSNERSIKDEKSENNKSKKSVSNKEEKKSESNKSKKVSNKEDRKSESNKSKKVSNKEEKKSESNKEVKNQEDKDKKNIEEENKDKDNEEENVQENQEDINNINNINNGEEKESNKENEENKDKENQEENINGSLPEENISDLGKESEDDNKNDTKDNEEEDEKSQNENIREKKTNNEEIINIKKKKKQRDEFFKNILKKKYKFKYMRAFYEESPELFEREYSIINFNDLFTTNDFFYLYVDIEINEMTYKRALKEDCRSFCSMYWSFLKYKNNFIFSFLKDYFNIIPVKISILIYSLSVYPFLSCIFITDSLLHNMYTKSNENQNHEILMDNALSIVQYIISPIIIDVLFFLFKKFVLFENDIIDLIHKKKYHSNYILQEMVKGYDVRDEKDELEKKKILFSIQNQNKKKNKSDEKNETYYGEGENYENFEGDSNGGNNYEKDFEENKTLINEIRYEANSLISRMNSKQSLFYLAAIIFSLFHFYYVSVFTTVYYNCTYKIIYSSAISLAISFIYPFLNCLVFVSLRYFGLNQGFKNCYKFSKVLAFL